uniref:Uncharacterized protein LOC111119968 n=1 Tax=Crassostrea virginica TaxID=6565 RepID=A0A8B8CM60_CRAVI|nr:uncharacterized protein LOC111119968 [Crassostrea virginica]
MKLFLWISLLFAGLLVRDCESFRLSRAWPWQAKVQRTTETDGIWRFMGITKDEFKLAYEKDLTPAIMAKIIGEIKNIISNLQAFLLIRGNEYKDGMMKRGGTGGGVVQINLKLLTDSLNIGKQIQNADDFRQPDYVETCMDAISPDAFESQKKYEFVMCALEIFKKTKDELDGIAFDDTFDTFLSIFEKYINAMVSFGQLLGRYEKVTGSKYMKRNLAATYLEELTKGLGEDLSEREWFQQ